MFIDSDIKGRIDIQNYREGETVATAWGQDEQGLCNAHLIAAAPELLAALRRAAPWLGKMIADGAHMNSILPKDCERTLDMIEAAIRKAEGK